MSAVYVYIYILGSRSNRSSRVLRVEGVVLCLILSKQQFHFSLCTQIVGCKNSRSNRIYGVKQAIHCLILGQQKFHVSVCSNLAGFGFLQALQGVPLVNLFMTVYLDFHFLTGIIGGPLINIFMRVKFDGFFYIIFLVFAFSRHYRGDL